MLWRSGFNLIRIPTFFRIRIKTKFVWLNIRKINNGQNYKEVTVVDNEKCLIFSSERKEHIPGASKIKLKNANKTRLVTENFSRHPSLIYIHCCLHQYITLKAVATAMAAIVVLTRSKSLITTLRITVGYLYSSWLLAAVWSFMSVKWSVALITFSQKYKTILDREYTLF